MKALVAITGRELWRRWLILPAALVLGFFPVVAPRLGWKGAGDPVVGLFGCLSLGIVAALASGQGVIGSELAAGRLGFFFSRPVPWWAIWGGKLSASVLLTALTALMAAVPWTVAAIGRPATLAALPDLPSVSFAAGLVLLAVGLAHAASIAYGSRSGLAALDLALFGVWLLALWSGGPLTVVGVLWVLGVERPFNYLQWPLALALLAASAVQVYAGRIDARRSHFVLSATLWSLLFAGLGVVTGFGWWRQQAVPGDIGRVDWVLGAPRGDWLWVTGRVRGHEPWWGPFPSFLYQVRTGRYLRLGNGWQTGVPAFATDGRSAVVLKEEYRQADGRLTGRLHLAALGAEKPSLAAIVPDRPLHLKHGARVTLCPDGGCVLLVQESALTLVALPSGQVTWEVEAGEGRRWSQVAFLDHERLRAFRVPTWPAAPPAAGAPLEIVAVRLSDGAREVTGGIEVQERVVTRPSPSGERLLVFQEGPARWKVTLCDGTSGRPIATLIEDAWNADADFLVDGRIALAEIRERNARLRLFGADGSEERTVELGVATFAMVGAESEPGRLFVGVRRPPRAGSETAVVDLAAGTLSHLPGLFPGRPAWLGHRDLPPARPTPGSLDATLFISDAGELVWLDPHDGARHVLLGGEKP